MAVAQRHAAAPFVLLALVVNLCPYRPGSATGLLVALDVPVLLWLAVAYSYTGGMFRSRERRISSATGGQIVLFTILGMLVQTS